VKRIGLFEILENVNLVLSREQRAATPNQNETFHLSVNQLTCVL